MALIILQQPQEYSPGYNQQPFVVRDTNVDDTNLTQWRLSCSVLRNGSVSDIIGSARVRYRAGSGGLAVFDPQRIIESELSHDHTPLDSASSPWEMCRKSMANYVAVFSSQFYDGTQWVAKDIAISRMQWVYNGGIEVVEFPTYDMNDYIMSSGDVLTNSPRAMTIGSNDSQWLHMIANAENTPQLMEVVTYDWSGGILNTYSITNVFNQFSGPVIIGSTVVQSPFEKRRRLRVAVGTRDLMALSSPVSFVGVGSYTVKFFNDTPAQLGSTFTFTLDDCTKFQRYRLHFLNRLGGFDAFDFKLKSVVGRKVSDKAFGKQFNVLGSSAYGYSSQSFGTVTYNTEVDKTLILNSDHISNEQAVWLEELATSPVIYLENADGTFTAMSRTNREYQIKRGEQDGVIYLELPLDYALQDIRQRG